MNLHKDTSDSLKPCRLMEGMLNRTADGTAPKAIRWFAVYHAAHCSRCGRFLTRVTALLGRLRGMKAERSNPPVEADLPAERWEAIEGAWAEAEK